MNKTKKFAIIILSTVMVTTVLIGGSLAYFTDVDEVENVLTLGHVDISLEEPIFRETTNGTYKIENILPTQVIEKDPTVSISGDSEDCYLRVRMEITGFDTVKGNRTIADYKNEIESLLEVKILDGATTKLVSLQDAESGWIKSGDYYYYQKGKLGMDGKLGVCGANDVIPVFSQFKIPRSWGNDVGDQQFEIKIYAEAVQADYFTPKRSEANDYIVGWFYEDGTEVVPEAYIP